MAITYNAPIRVNALAVGNAVAFVVAADGHGYVQPVPATGVGYPTVASIFQAPAAPGAGGTDGLWTVYLTGNAYAKPIDFTLNANTDWVVTATGTS